MEKGGEGEMYGKSNIEVYITICKSDSQFISCMAQETPVELCINLEGRDMGGRFKREGLYVYLWQLHVEV